MGVDLVPQAFLFEGRSEARFQQNWIEGLEQIVDGAELDATRHAVHLGERRDHDHGEIAQPRLILEPGEHLKAVDFRHHHVEEDEVEGARLEERNRFLAVPGGRHIGVAFEIEMRSEEHTSELQSQSNLVCRLLLEKKKHTRELQSQSRVECRYLREIDSTGATRSRGTTDSPRENGDGSTQCSIQRADSSEKIAVI